MGTSVTGQLTLGETQFLGTQAQAMGSIGQPNVATGKFNFFAGFDGTLNDRNNVPAGEYQTNVANLVACTHYFMLLPDACSEVWFQYGPDALPHWQDMEDKVRRLLMSFVVKRGTEPARCSGVIPKLP